MLSWFAKLLFFVNRYKLCLNTRSRGKESQECNGAISAMTSPDVPSPPTITEVRQVKDTVQITWTPPAQPNGVLVKYIISLHLLKDDGSVDSSAGRVRVWSTESADTVTILVRSFHICLRRPVLLEVVLKGF